MGREDDWKHCEDLRCRDDARQCEMVNEAHMNLYDKGYALAGKYVDGHLKGESMVPTLVWICLFVLWTLVTHQPSLRMPSQQSSPNLDSIITRW